MLKRTITLALVLAGSCLAAHAQPSLRDLVNEAQAEWMMGTWEGPTDDGQTLTHTFAWDLDKKIIVMKGKVGDMAYLGITAIDPETGEPKYSGYDSQGTVSKGTWSEESGDVALRIDGHSPTEGKRKIGVVFGKASGGGLQLRMHGVDQWGYLQYPAAMTINLKKKAGK
ncbi:MAG: hypothetical protein KDM81_04320 [Verrucomicrobiae bacterium]|nr:hypothetical protein [Verrucomicrobiae bacterium]